MTSRYSKPTTTTAVYSSSVFSSVEFLRGPTAAAAAARRNSHRLFSTTTNADGAAATGSVAATNDTDGDGDRWKESPLVNPTITFETLLVPNSQLTRWITHPDLQHRLAKPENWDILRHIHPRIKLVQDYNIDDAGDDDDDTNGEGIDKNSKTKKSRYKQLLLMPKPEADGDSDGQDQEEEEWLSELLSSSGDDEAGDNAEDTVRMGPSRTMRIAPHQLTFQYLLNRLLPESALPPPSAYEQIGHVAHFNLREHHLPHKHLIGSALLESTTSGGDSIRTVVNKVGRVDGKFRTYECEILANVHRPPDDDPSSSSSSLLETTVVEDGISIELNVAECYWCTRLSGERRELLGDILGNRGGKPPKKDAEAVSSPPLVVADVFCGAGAVCMLLAKKIKDRDKAWKPELLQQQNKRRQQQKPTTEETFAVGGGGGEPSVTILANDWNPKAIEYMKRSIVTNGMDKDQDEALYHRFELSCGDSYDFLSALGEELPATKTNPYVKHRRGLQQRLGRRGRGGGNNKNKNKSRSASEPVVAAEAAEAEPVPEPPRMPDHVLMNFPLEAPRFLGSLRWWSWKRLRDEGIRRRGRGAGDRPWHPRFHVYTFARSSSPRAGDEDEMAVNLVADELLPRPPVGDVDDDGVDDVAPGTESGSDAGTDDAAAVAVRYRREELNEEFGTDFSTRIVRDVAPGKVVVCVAFSVTPKLIRYMQGDYS